MCQVCGWPKASAGVRSGKMLSYIKNHVFVTASLPEDIPENAGFELFLHQNEKLVDGTGLIHGLS